MSRPSLKLNCLARTDGLGQQYYFTRPDIPVNVDLSKCVIFVRTGVRNGEKYAEIDIKTYTGKDSDPRPDDDSAA